MQRSFTIITACMGRLDHLKQTLPRMLDQGAEVIVVDYSCPDGTAAYVADHFPQARVVKVEGEQFFSNWKARNAGAAAATGRILVFCDSDTMLAPGAIAWIDGNLPPRNFGYFERVATSKFNKTGLRLGLNQLRGFHAVPAPAFRRSGGYDELMRGYAVGADTEFEIRLMALGLARFKLDPTIVEDVVQHGNDERMRRHRDPIAVSYATGFLYRKAKIALMQLQRRANLPLAARQKLYAASETAARSLRSERDVATVTVDVDRELLGMPLQLGYTKVGFKMTLRLTLSGEGPVDEIPEFTPEAEASPT